MDQQISLSGGAQMDARTKITPLVAVAAIVFNVAYIWSLFAIGLAGVLLYNWILRINFGTITAIGVVALIFGIITSIDFTLLYFEKVTPVVILWVMFLAIPLMLYALFVGSELFKIDNKRIPIETKELIFHRRFC
jgi:hypothetical protein